MLMLAIIRSLFMLFWLFFFDVAVFLPQCSRFSCWSLVEFLPVQPAPKENRYQKKSRNVIRRRGGRDGVLAAFYLSYVCFFIFGITKKTLPRVISTHKMLRGVSAENLGHFCTFMLEKLEKGRMEA